MKFIYDFLADKYARKRLVISFIFITGVAFFFGFVYFMTRPAQTCFDGKKNQDEKGVDCEGVCAKKCAEPVIIDLLIVKKGFLNSGSEGKYDLYGEIKNPNNTFGGGSFEYEFILKNKQGAVVGKKSGHNFILPGELKYVIENNIEVEDDPYEIELKIFNSKWVEFQEHYQEPQLKVVNKRYQEIRSGIGFSEATGLLKNESPFDFSLIDLAIILKSPSDEVLAVNSTEMRTVRTGENRDFRSLWLSRFPGEVMNVEVQASANVFDSETFAEKNFSAKYREDSSYR